LDGKKRFYLFVRADWTEKNVFIPPRGPIERKKNVFIPPRGPIERKKTFLFLRAGRLNGKKRFYSSARAD